jgi:zinc-ribbon domain
LIFQRQAVAWTVENRKSAIQNPFMFEPEIAHRCSSCGASVRQSAPFCHQCGKAMTGHVVSPPVNAHEAQKVDEPEASYVELTGFNAHEAQKVDEPEASYVELTGFNAHEAQKVDEPEASYVEPTGSKQAPGELSKTQPAIDPRTKPLREQRQAKEQPSQQGRTIERATRSTRAGLEGNVLGRVERIRKVSSVVIDQAAYDPSVRFLLVAGVLFLLFLILLIVSKMIG